MKRRRILILLSEIIFLLTVLSADEGIYKFDEYLCYGNMQWANTYRELQTDIDYSSPASVRNLLNIRNIKYCRIDTVEYDNSAYHTSNELKTYIEFKFDESARKLYEESEFFEKKYVRYEYDEENRLISDGNYFTYTYNDALSRNVFYNKKLQKTEQIKITNDGYIVVSKENGSETRCRYFFSEDNKLKKIKEECINHRGKVYANFEINFTYMDNSLTQVRLNINPERTDITNIKYDSDGYMCEVESISYEQPDELKDKTTFSNYDKYGNWLNAKTLKNGKVKYIVTRTINYFDMKQ